MCCIEQFDEDAAAEKIARQSAAQSAHEKLQVRLLSSHMTTGNMGLVLVVHYIPWKDVIF